MYTDDDDDRALARLQRDLDAKVMICIPTLKPRPADAHDLECIRYYTSKGRNRRIERALFEQAKRTGESFSALLDEAYSWGTMIYPYISYDRA